MTPWDAFFHHYVQKIFSEKRCVIDIGGGLRAVRGRGNRYEPSRAWLSSLIEKVNYKIMDPVPDYRPDLIGDIEYLPFQDNTQEAIICLAVLEHVQDPWKACREIRRVLIPGGFCLLYVPFLYYYHAEKGYYKDYWRFTQDALSLLLQDFTEVDIQNVRGAIETWLHLSPFGKCTPLRAFCRWCDKAYGKIASRQVSGYYVFCVK
ncbi:MAG: class I SAM-dependent methyltransferase [Patescibacteria group bacterium]